MTIQRLVPPFLLFLGFLHPMVLVHADSSSSDEPKKTYYWQGTQLNNLSRLGSSSDFEEEQRRTQEGKSSDAYLTSIREQMAERSKADLQKKKALIFQGQLPGNPIELTYLSPGLRITLHAEALFEENSTALKPSAIETIERLGTLLQTETQKPLQLVLSDRIDDVPPSASVDAERSLLVLSLLKMPTKTVEE